MAKIYGQLERAQLENRTSDTAASVAGLIWWNSVEGKVKLDDGTLVRAMLRNDDKLILGNSSTASDNLKLHRGASSVLQVLRGDDTTVEGTLGTTLGAIDAKIPAFVYASRPSAGNAGRMIWVSDRSAVMVDSGTAWVPVGSGGGGGSLSWVEDAASPLASVENNAQIYLFQSGLGQKLYALIRVPSGYVAGSQIKLKLTFYSGDSSGTALIQATSTLIRPGTTAMTSTANQYTSTNAAVSLSVGSVDVPQALDLDLSSTAGVINIAVAAGDLIKVELTRGTDTSALDLKVPVYGAEVSFS